MLVNTEGIVLKSIVTGTDRRIIYIFTRHLGKIYAGSKNLNRSKGKSINSISPFTHADYILYKGKDLYNINTSHVIKSFYKISDDMDRYMYACFIIELTEKMLPQEQKEVKLFELLLSFLGIIENRTKDFLSLVIAYQLKALSILGLMPEINKCVSCNEISDNYSFVIKEGGLICTKCDEDDKLAYNINNKTINVINYIINNSLERLAKLSLDNDVKLTLNEIIEQYIKHHLNITNLNSAVFINKKNN